MASPCMDCHFHMVSLAFVCIIQHKPMHIYTAKVNEGNFGRGGNDWKLFTFQEWGEASAK